MTLEMLKQWVDRRFVFFLCVFLFFERERERERMMIVDDTRGKVGKSGQ